MNLRETARGHAPGSKQKEDGYKVCSLARGEEEHEERQEYSQSTWHLSLVQHLCGSHEALKKNLFRCKSMRAA